ncbi:MAG TPA: hypothetical protein VEU98_07020 [Candidatus Eremiobacteraceae bacterium]|nr:hypothetical protein [Candidatus Eremiobacteraceae bacterium]
MNAKLILAIILFVSLLVPVPAAQKPAPTPSLKPGETLFYLIHLKTSRMVKAKSVVELPDIPDEARIDVDGILQVEVVDANAPSVGTVALRTWFLTLVGDINSLQRGKKPDSAPEERTPAEHNVVDCILQSDGQIIPLAGLDKLGFEQQAAWREWATHFAGTFRYERQARKRGEKWSNEEPETSPAPIAGLFWQSKSQYVHDEPCAPSRFEKGEFRRTGPQENCAVILTDAKLGQKSSTQDSTPPDYKIKGLKTRGTAKGNNETILYISQKNRRLVRATQDAKQQMEVTITLLSTNGTVRYEVQANAYSSVELVADLPLILHPKSAD